ncbi:Fur family transcriptional regulator [Buchananella felis]|uniref:Fur family transcriptional regulator n=1 Tax=Buchananella felis TaxID=3231492 RepID=UPI0035296473
MTSEKYRAALKEAGLRVTAPRLAVLEILERHPHATADVVVGHARDQLGAVSKQAVYDVLSALTLAGLVRRNAVEGGGARYELEREDNHHHLWCTSCGRYEDAVCVVGAPPCAYPADDKGFAINMADVVYRGICPQCQESLAKQEN